MRLLLLITFGACVYAQAPASHIFYGESYNGGQESMAVGFFGVQIARGATYWESRSSSTAWVGAFYDVPITPINWLVVGFSPFSGPVYLMGSNDNVTFTQISSITGLQSAPSYGAGVCNSMYGCWYQTISGAASYAYFRYQVTHSDFDYVVTLWDDQAPTSVGAMECATAVETYNTKTYATVGCAHGVSIESVRFASFGTPAKGGCGLYAPGDCFLDIIAYAQNLCVGKNSCSVANNYQLFFDLYGRDPCPGWQKTLTLQVQCSAVPSTGWTYKGTWSDPNANVHLIPYTPNAGGAVFLPPSIDGDATIANCISWAIQNNLNVIGMQYGGQCFGCFDCDYMYAGLGKFCGSPLGCAYTNEIYVYDGLAFPNSPLPPPNSPPPPPILPPPPPILPPPPNSPPPNSPPPNSPPPNSPPPNSPPPNSPPPNSPMIQQFVVQTVGPPSGPWIYQGAFYDANVYGQRTISQSANINWYGFTCYPNGDSCVNQYSMNLLECQSWATNHGFDTLAMQGPYCLGCKQCLYEGTGPAPVNANGVNLIYTTFGSIPPMTPPNLPSSTVPAPASLVGYNIHTFSSNSFSPSNVDVQSNFLPTRSANTQWWFQEPYFHATNCHDSSCVQFNADGSVTLTKTGIRTFRVYPGQQTMGVGFGGGAYVEAVFSFDGSKVDRSVDPNAWPAFWANSLEFMDYPEINNVFPGYEGSNLYGTGSTSVTRYVETDVLEAYNSYDTTDYIATMHDWSRDNSGTPENGQTHQQRTVSLPSGVSFRQKNTYGFLWLPATATTRGSFTTYLNGAVVAQNYPTWTQYNCSNVGNDYFNNPAYSPFSIVDCQHLSFMFDTGLNEALTVYSFDVWQASAAKNVYPGASL